MIPSIPTKAYPSVYLADFRGYFMLYSREDCFLQEPALWRCSAKISQKSQKDTCVGASFLAKLKACFLVNIAKFLWTHLFTEFLWWLLLFCSFWYMMALLQDVITILELLYLLKIKLFTRHNARGLTQNKGRDWVAIKRIFFRSTS